MSKTNFDLRSMVRNGQVVVYEFDSELPCGMCKCCQIHNLKSSYKCGIDKTTQVNITIDLGLDTNRQRKICEDQGFQIVQFGKEKVPIFNTTLHENSYHYAPNSQTMEDKPQNSYVRFVIPILPKPLIKESQSQQCTATTPINTITNNPLTRHSDIGSGLMHINKTFKTSSINRNESTKQKTQFEHVSLEHCTSAASLNRQTNTLITNKLNSNLPIILTHQDHSSGVIKNINDKDTQSIQRNVDKRFTSSLDDHSYCKEQGISSIIPNSCRIPVFLCQSTVQSKSDQLFLLSNGEHLDDTSNIRKDNTNTKLKVMDPIKSTCISEGSLSAENNFISNSEKHTSNLDTFHPMNQCKRCGEDFKFNKELLIHSLLKHWQCRFCDKGFTKYEKYIGHLWLHTGEDPLLCKICGERFLSTYILEIHKRTVHIERPFGCQTCDQRFSSISKLETHKRVVHTDRPFNCQTCGKRFITNSRLELHKRVVHKECLFACKTCDKKFDSKSKLKSHKRIVHLVRSFTCQTCDARFTSNSKLDIHKHLVHMEKPFVCLTCGKTLATKSSLESHKRIHTGEKPFSCKVCSTRFISLFSLKSHERTHTGERTCVCNVCNKRFMSHYKLKIHNSTVHSSERPYMCEICGKSFKTSDYMRNHKTVHAHAHYVCKICGRKFKTRSALRLHEYRIHISVKPIACLTCDDMFNDENELQLHVCTHTGEKPHLCEICGKAFRELENLLLHKRTHVGPHSYDCKCCGKSFSHWNQRDWHENKLAGKKPYACTTCGKAFIGRPQLNIHKLSHSSDRPYVCNICGKGFALKYRLTRHTKTHAHKEMEKTADKNLQICHL